MQNSREFVSDDEVDDGYASSSSNVTTSSNNQLSQVERSSTITPDQHSRPLPRNVSITISPRESGADDDFPPIRKRKTALYDPVSERQTSYAESRQLYQRHQLDSQNVGGSTNATNLDGIASSVQSPLTRPMSRVQSSQQQYNSALPVGHGQSSWRLPSPASPGTTRDSQARPLIEADQAARQHGLHPGLPHENKGTFIEHMGIHGAGAGIGLGTGQGGYASSDATVVAELGMIYENIATIRDLRHKFIRLSLQGDTDNPKDDPGWKIYPPAPETVSGPTGQPRAWNDDGNGDTSINGQSRKLGKDIGADFNLDDLLPVPGKGDMFFKLDDEGVFQVYENSESVEIETPVVPIPSLREWYIALDKVITAAADGPSKSYAFRRLQFLEKRYELYALANEYQETVDSKKVPHRDFYNVRKVDSKC